MGLSFKKKGETPKIDALLTYQISQSKPQNDPFGSVLGSTKTKNLPGLATVCGPFAHASTRQFHRLPRRKLGKWSTTGFSTWNCWFPGGYSKMVARCWYQPNQRMGFSENLLETMVLTVRYIGGSCGFSPLTQRDKWLQHPRNISSPSHWRWSGDPCSKGRGRRWILNTCSDWSAMTYPLREPQSEQPGSRSIRSNEFECRFSGEEHFMFPTSHSTYEVRW
jgi:hypothetical protein